MFCADHEQDWQPYRLVPNMMTNHDHSYSAGRLGVLGRGSRESVQVSHFNRSIIRFRDVNHH